MGLDRQGRPTLLLVVERIAARLTPDVRDRLLLHVLAKIEPVATACGEAGYALLLLHADFNWDMDLGWLQAARQRAERDGSTTTALMALPLMPPLPCS